MSGAFLHRLRQSKSSEIRAREQEFREIGLRTVREGKVGAVLLAGGQGTRLGLDKPKGTLNIGINRTLYLFEQLLRNLSRCDRGGGGICSAYIMTSNINDKDTKEFFEEHDYFGYPKEEVRFFVQEMEPGMTMDEKRVLMESGTEPAMSPEREWRLVWLDGVCRTFAGAPAKRN